jgi:high-affinity K+ transport system ATPase subunit B
MRSVSSKAPAIIAMLISLVSFGFLVSAFVVSINEAPPEMGVSASFALWLLSVVISMISLIPYTIDAILSAIKIFVKINPLFNSILTLILIGAIPMAIFVGTGTGINIYIWFSYYWLMFILEIVSIIKHAKMARADRKMEKESIKI